VAVDLGTVLIVSAPLLFPRAPLIRRIPGSRAVKESLAVGALANLGIKLIAGFLPTGIRGVLSPVSYEPTAAAQMESYIEPAYGLDAYVYQRESLEDPRDLTLNTDIVPFGDMAFSRSLRDMGDD
jgi:hypothetical protein